MSTRRYQVLGELAAERRCRGGVDESGAPDGIGPVVGRGVVTV